MLADARRFAYPVSVESLADHRPLKSSTARPDIVRRARECLPSRAEPDGSVPSTSAETGRPHAGGDLLRHWPGAGGGVRRVVDGRSQPHRGHGRREPRRRRARVRGPRSAPPAGNPDQVERARREPRPGRCACALSSGARQSRSRRARDGSPRRKARRRRPGPDRRGRPYPGQRGPATRRVAAGSAHARDARRLGAAPARGVHPAAVCPVPRVRRQPHAR